MSFSWEAGSGYYVPVPADRSSADALLNKFRPVLESEKIGKVAQNLKYDYLIMKWYGVN